MKCICKAFRTTGFLAFIFSPKLIFRVSGFHSLLQIGGGGWGISIPHHPYAFFLLTTPLPSSIHHHQISHNQHPRRKNENLRKKEEGQCRAQPPPLRASTAEPAIARRHFTAQIRHRAPPCRSVAPPSL